MNGFRTYTLYSLQFYFSQIYCKIDTFVTYFRSAGND